MDTSAKLSSVTPSHHLKTECRKSQVAIDGRAVNLVGQIVTNTNASISRPRTCQSDLAGPTQ
jgi:hypothetical protein